MLTRPSGLHWNDGAGWGVTCGRYGVTQKDCGPAPLELMASLNRLLAARIWSHICTNQMNHMVKYELSRGLNKSEGVGLNVTVLLRNPINGTSCSHLQGWWFRIEARLSFDISNIESLLESQASRQTERRSLERMIRPRLKSQWNVYCPIYDKNT